MSYVTTNPLKNSTIMLLYSEKDNIKLDPPYQRKGDVWTKEKRQLLIDSILNDYDIPKIYFHVLSEDQKNGSGHDYSVIDGRQRLEAIWRFIDGDFPLSQEFEYQRNISIKLAGLTYDDIAQEHPKIKIKFDSFVLPVVGVETDDEDLIEDMFSRLNEAVPLNAAEKRNALGGYMVACIRNVAEHNLFKTKVTFSDRRYQHREIAARLLLTELSLTNENRLIDTKKVYLDQMAKLYSSGRDAEVDTVYQRVIETLNCMDGIFSATDPLLRAQGNMAVYFLLFRRASQLGEIYKITRRKLLDFISELERNRELASTDYERSSFELLEYDRLTQQGTNDASNIKERYSVLAKYIGLSHIEI